MLNRIDCAYAVVRMPSVAVMYMQRSGLTLSYPFSHS